MKKETGASVLKCHMKSHMDLYFLAFLVGIFSGVIAVAYRVSLSYAEIFRRGLYTYARENFGIEVLLGLVIFGIVVSLILGWIVVNIPMVKGSGIPQVKGIIARQMNFNWARELGAKFFGGVLAIVAGMSLGREGPSVQLGAEVGSGIFKIFKRKEYDKKYLITCGASAGLSAAFGAPIAGTIFAIEELHKFMSPLLVTCVLIASVSAEFVSKNFFGFSPSFNIHVEGFYQLKDYLLIIVLSIIITFIGKLFSDGILYFQKKYKGIKLNPIIKPVIVVAITIIMGIFFFDVTGGGHGLAERILHESFTYKTLFILLVLKFIFTLICYSTGIPGGIFLPMLVIGAIIGKIYGMFVIDLFDLTSTYDVYFIIIGMATLLTTVVKSPLTGTVLILEMTGSFYHFFPVVTACMATFLMSEVIGIKPIYDLLLENMLPKKEEISGDEEKKTLVKIPIGPDSEFDNIYIKDIKWPGRCIIVDIERGDKCLTPTRDTLLQSGDLLVILMNENTANKVTPILLKMGEGA